MRKWAIRRQRIPNLWRHLRFGVLAVIASASWSTVPVRAAEPVFSGTEILEITIRAPLDGLSHTPAGEIPVTGVMELDGVARIPVSLTPYGISRLEECSSPLLEIELDPETTADTPFAGHPRMRLVRPCHRGSSYEEYILLEYLVYRSYALVAEPALHTRLVRCRFQDTLEPSSEDIGLSFFVEDIDAAAARNGLSWLDVEVLDVGDLDPDRVALLALFQYMVGNTDWSVLEGAEGQRCCHNMAVLGVQGDLGKPILLPYDFDFAGVVNPPYALPDEQLPIHRVTQRAYRGFCAHNDRIPAAIEHFNRVRPQLEALYADERLPSPKARQRALKYIGSFYETINDPQGVLRKILRHCR